MDFRKAFIILLVAVIPRLAEAAGADVTLTTDATILVNGITLNITGSSAVIQSITVNPASFTVTLASGSSIAITAPGRNVLTNDATSDVVSSVCDDSASSLSLAYSGAGTVTNTITPSATLCATPASAPPAPAPVALGGGGWISSVIGTVMNLFSKPEAVLTSSGLNLSLNIGTGSTGDSVVLLQTWLIEHGYDIPAISSGAASKGYFGLQTRFAVQKYQTDKLIPSTGFVGPLTRKALQGVTPLAPPVACPAGYVCTPIANGSAEGVSSGSPLLKKDLYPGATDPDVKVLQAYLNRHGFAVSPSGPGSIGQETDYFGPATQRALTKLQIAVNMTPALGFLDMVAREYINTNP